MTLPDLDLTVGTTPFTLVNASGASLTLTGGLHKLDGGGLAGTFDRGGLLGAGSTVLEVDFSLFNTTPGAGVVDSCSGPGCGSLPALNLDGVRFALDGAPTGVCGESYVLRIQTDNTSYYEVGFDTIAIVNGKNVPVPTLFVYLGIIGLALIGMRMRRLG